MSRLIDKLNQVSQAVPQAMGFRAVQPVSPKPRMLLIADLAQADVVTLYLTTSANDKVKPKLESELKPGTRVVSHDYEILGWRPVKIDNFCENPHLGYPSHTIYVYKR
jgi:hypothetical protein